MGRIGWQELLFLGMILLVLFGATKLPAIGRGMGEGAVRGGRLPGRSLPGSLSKGVVALRGE